MFSNPGLFCSYLWWCLNLVDWSVPVLNFFLANQPVGRAVTHLSLEWEIWGSNLGPVKSDTVLPTACHSATFFQKKLCCPGSSVRRILKRGGQKFQKICEEQKSESEVVPLKFSLIFRPNLGEEQKKKKRSLLKVHPVFHPNSLKFPAKSLMPNLQRGGGHASILLTLLCNFAILATQRGGHGPMAPP